MKKTTDVRLSRLETRFLLNFALDENNNLVHPKFASRPPHSTNLNNLIQKFPQKKKHLKKYAKLMISLTGKLMRADRTFYSRSQKKINA